MDENNNIIITISISQHNHLRAHDCTNSSMLPSLVMDSCLPCCPAAGTAGAAGAAGAVGAESPAAALLSQRGIPNTYDRGRGTDAKLLLLLLLLLLLVL